MTVGIKISISQGRIYSFYYRFTPRGILGVPRAGRLLFGFFILPVCVFVFAGAGLVEDFLHGSTRRGRITGGRGRFPGRVLNKLGDPFGNGRVTWEYIIQRK